MADPLKVVAAIREALKGIEPAKIPNSYTATTEAWEALQSACNPEAITTVLDALDAALERVKVLEANDRRYRWLRIYYTPVDSIDGVPDELDRAMMVGGNILDAAIDAAMEVKHG